MPTPVHPPQPEHAEQTPCSPPPAQPAHSAWLINDDTLFADNPPRMFRLPRTTLSPAARRRRRLIGLGATCGVLAAVVLAVWLFLPGLRRPVDLGISADLEDYQEAVRLLGLQNGDAPQSGLPEDYTCVYASPQPVDLALTSEQLTALFACNRPVWEPIDNLQIRLEDDGTATLSARVPKQWIVEQLLAGLYTQQELEYVLPGLLPEQLHICLNVGGSVRGNRTQLQIHQASVMGLGIPASLLQAEEAGGIIAQVLDEYLSRLNALCGLEIQLAYVTSGGRLALTGALPAGQQWLPAEN